MFYKIFLLLYIKISERNSVECNSIEYSYLTYYQKNGDVILNRAKDYCETDKERLRTQARYKWRKLSKK